MLFAAGIVAAWVAWVIAVLIVALARRRQTRKLRTSLWSLAGLPVSEVVMAGLAVGLWWHSHRPDVVFQAEFGFLPPADTTVLNSDVSWIGDSGRVYLHFRTSPQTVSCIVTAGGFTPDAGRVSSTVTPPKGFAPPAGASAVV